MHDSIDRITHTTAFVNAVISSFSSFEGRPQTNLVVNPHFLHSEWCMICHHRSVYQGHKYKCLKKNNKDLYFGLLTTVD